MNYEALKCLRIEEGKIGPDVIKIRDILAETQDGSHSYGAEQSHDLPRILTDEERTCLFAIATYFRINLSIVEVNGTTIISF